MVMRDKLRDRAPEMTPAQQNHPVEALLFDRSDEPLSVRIRIRSAGRRQNHSDASDRSVGWGVDPSTWARREAMSMTNTALFASIT
jgi:hypothetical protein